MTASVQIECTLIGHSLKIKRIPLDILYNLFYLHQSLSYKSKSSTYSSY